jgi:uncharacterized protein YjbJ (UPF0337 family)
METKFKIKGNWTELKAKLKDMYPKLSDEDLNFKAGKEDELFTRLEKKLGVSRDEIEDTIDDLQQATAKKETFKPKQTKTTKTK